MILRAFIDKPFAYGILNNRICKPSLPQIIDNHIVVVCASGSTKGFFSLLFFGEASVSVLWAGVPLHNCKTALTKSIPLTLMRYCSAVLPPISHLSRPIKAVTLELAGGDVV